MNWNECACKFEIDTHPTKGEHPYNQIYIEKVDRFDGTYKWAVRWDGSALCKPHEDVKEYHFLVEKDFRGEEKALVRFDTKEEALEAYNLWKAQGDFE